MREPEVSIIRTQRHAKLGATGEHAVGFRGASGRKVIDQDPDVTLGSADGEGRSSPGFKHCVDPGNDTLGERNGLNFGFNWALGHLTFGVRFDRCTGPTLQPPPPHKKKQQQTNNKTNKQKSIPFQALTTQGACIF